MKTLLDFHRQLADTSLKVRHFELLIVIYIAIKLLTAYSTIFATAEIVNQLMSGQLRPEWMATTTTTTPPTTTSTAPPGQ